MTIYESKKIIYHLSKEEGYKVLNTLNNVESKIKMRQYGDKVSFSELAEHYKNDDLVIKLIKKQSEREAKEYGIRIEIANSEHVFVEFEAYIEEDKFDTFVGCIEMAINSIMINSTNDENSEILSIDTSTSDTIFYFSIRGKTIDNNFTDIELFINFRFVMDNCWLKFNLEDLEEEDHKTFEIHAE